MQASANIGGLWVSYDVTLVKPQISPIDSSSAIDRWQILNVNSTNGFTDVQEVTNDDRLGGYLSVVSTTQTNYNFPPGLASGTYQLTLVLHSNTVPLVYTAFSMTVNANLVFSANYNDGTLSQVSTAGTSQSLIIVCNVRLINTNAVVSIFGTLPATSSTADFTVSQIAIGQLFG